MSTQQNEYPYILADVCRDLLKSWTIILNRHDINLSEVRLRDFSPATGDCNVPAFKQIVFGDKDGRYLHKDQVDIEIATLAELMRPFSAHMLAQFLDVDFDSLHFNPKVLLHQGLGEKFDLVLIFSRNSCEEDEVFIIEKKRLVTVD